MITQGYPLEAVECEPVTSQPIDVYLIVGWLPINEDRTQFRPVLASDDLSKGGTAFLADPTKLYEIAET